MSRKQRCIHVHRVNKTRATSLMFMAGLAHAAGQGAKRDSYIWDLMLMLCPEAP